MVEMAYLYIQTTRAEATSALTFHLIHTAKPEECVKIVGREEKVWADLGGVVNGLELKEIVHCRAQVARLLRYTLWKY